MPQSPLDPMGGSMGKPDRTPHSPVPSQPDIDTLEKLAWDAHVEHVVIWYRDQIAELLARVRETERELTLSTKALQRRVADLEAEHVSREDREAAAHDLAEAAQCGAELAAEIAEHEAEPWRWQYPRTYLSDWAAYRMADAAAHMARSGLRLLKLEDA